MNYICRIEMNHDSDVIMSAMVSNHQPHDCLLNRLFRRRSKKTSELPVTGLCVGNSPMNSPQKGHIWWRHHETTICGVCGNTKVCVRFLVCPVIPCNNHIVMLLFISCTPAASLTAIDYSLWDISIHPCHNFNGGLTKSPFRRGHG